eukprot:CAMPEP_0170567184 /NCGR_PEP_ID=MMETSP0211-20121228/80318_1 /TAXON_ID=311385 /ORGANISM="Pseudokeronopsis sp., Strain OXSARD2" /LENGTH=106 /DNA_ID=CAMNT_0010888571 /DNA_START=1209 /DNA_END=1529 /DNA_ORIENTATION=+
MDSPLQLVLEVGEQRFVILEHWVALEDVDDAFQSHERPVDVVKDIVEVIFGVLQGSLVRLQPLAHCLQDLILPLGVQVLVLEQDHQRVQREGADIRGFGTELVKGA